MADEALVDTDVASALYRAHFFAGPVPVEVAAVVQDRDLYVSVVTLGEALYGAARRKWSMHRTSRLREFYLAQFGDC